ncbi:MAG TPA: efflux RND transporter periplasmic adaptor subunit [Bryobacteraceae bacterium]|nr:efflux RND transporter periplasmic adaptor subunit [Bryobacteraceae bacterium]
MTVEQEPELSPGSQAAAARQVAQQQQAAQQPAPQRAGVRGLVIFTIAAALVLGIAIAGGLIARAKSNAALLNETNSDAVPTVSVIHPQITSGAEEVVLPGNMQAFVDTPIWARSSGYLKAWYVDIGAHVKQAQLLATIESPEVDQQLEQAKEQLNTAQANLKLSEITAERYTNLFKTDSVAKQDVDNAVQAAAANAAMVKSATANVSRLQQMVDYEKVYAPFDGVITARNVDLGALVDADTNTAGKELFHLASNNTLRVYVSVPEAYSRSAIPGVNASLTLNEFPGRQFKGKIVRNADAIDMNSRTLLVEVDVPNPTGELLPGSYVSVHLKIPSKVRAVVIPANALLFRSEGLRVAVVRDNRTVLQAVLLGRDFGDTVEVVSGVGPADSVIVNPSDSIVSGQQVNAQKAAS